MSVFILSVLGIAFSVASCIQLQAIPSSIESGLTRTLNVNCSTITDGKMSSVISLIISRSTGADDTTFKELNSLNGFQPSGHVTEHLRDNQTATGIIDNNGVSFLSLVWEYPDSSNAGLYMCEAHGVDDSGHPVSINSTLLVMYYYPDAAVLVNEIRNINSKLDAIQTSVQDMIRIWNGRIESIKVLFFNGSIHFNHHVYYLSYPKGTYSIVNYNAVCELFGGYLVEIDSIEEFNTLRGFVSNYPEFEYVMMGATEEGHEGHWVNIHSSTVVANIQWAQGEPVSNPLANCLWLMRDKNWYMHEGHCQGSEARLRNGFICEI